MYGLKHYIHTILQYVHLLFKNHIYVIHHTYIHTCIYIYATYLFGNSFYFIVSDESGDLDFYTFDWRPSSNHSATTMTNIAEEEPNKVGGRGGGGGMISTISI